MRKNNNCLFILFLLFPALILAQSEKATITLKQILEQISIQHQVKFNYIENEIAIFSLAPPAQELKLEAKLDYISKETQLKFVAFNKKYYTIVDDPKLDKPLCGYLLDSQSNLPVENALVQISGTQVLQSTDQNGYFELPVVSPNLIEFRHQSYEPKKIDPRLLYVSHCPKIKIEPIFQELTEVVAQQYLTSGICKKKDGTIEAQPKKFGILPGLTEPDVLQTIQQMPGIYSADETVSNISVRGGTHDQNLFLWNGIRMFQTGHFFGLISAFNPSLAHKITIAKNGSSAFFGESVSSVVDISTHSKNIEDSQTSIGSDLISADFYTKFKLSPKASIELSSRRSLTDFFSTTTYRNYSNRVFQNTIVTDLQSSNVNPIKSDQTFYFYDLTFQYQQKISHRHELTLDAITIRNHLDVDQTNNTNQRNSFLGQENIGGALNWKTIWNNKLTSQINFYGSYYNLDATRNAIQNNQVFKQQNTLLDLGLQIKSIYRFSEKLSIHSGYQWDEIGVSNDDEINSPAFSRHVKEINRTHVGILEINYQSPSKKTLLTVGGRLNHFENFEKSRVESRIQFHQSLTQYLSLELLTEQKSQTLSQIIDLQQDFLGIEKRRWTLANNASIPITTSHQWSIGLTFKNPKWLLTWDNFYKKVNGITSNSQGFQNQFEFAKTTGSYDVIGTEMLVQRHFKRYQTWISYSYNENRYSFQSLNAQEFPNNFELAHTLSAMAAYNWNQIKVAIGGKWHTGKPLTEPSSTTLNVTNPAQPTIDYKTPNSSRLPEYFQLNFSASKIWKWNQKTELQTSFSVLNLLNKQNTIHQYYRVNATQTGIESVRIYSLERTPNLSVKFRF
ncbi:TonB-dependent receptor [Flavobacterium sp. CYK-4]|uniref:TonB-dependent receptor n=1 Tax=Flavobacterium lotistagni TaxID=2709660 RepID=UPI001409E0EE|nr:TonB-dependent receptor plug domain-containing protein [Flavobacterium lotistagni]NHM06357.1 TonB-dependent receptor [Flavobacterium lotistagni]